MEEINKKYTKYYDISIKFEVYKILKVHLFM